MGVSLIQEPQVIQESQDVMYETKGEVEALESAQEFFGKNPPPLATSHTDKDARLSQVLWAIDNAMYVSYYHKAMSLRSLIDGDDSKEQGWNRADKKILEPSVEMLKEMEFERKQIEIFQEQVVRDLEDSARYLELVNEHVTAIREQIKAVQQSIVQCSEALRDDNTSDSPEGISWKKGTEERIISLKAEEKNLKGSLGFMVSLSESAENELTAAKVNAAEKLEQMISKTGTLPEDKTMEKFTSTGLAARIEKLKHNFDGAKDEVKAVLGGICRSLWSIVDKCKAACAKVDVLLTRTKALVVETEEHLAKQPLKVLPSMRTGI